MNTLAARVDDTQERVLGRSQLRPRRLLLGADAVAACLSLFAGIGVMYGRGQLDTSGSYAFGTATSLLTGALIVIVTLVLMMRAGQYSQSRRLSRLADSAVLTRSLVIAGAVVALAGFVTKDFFLDARPSRLVVLSMLIIFWMLAVAGRVLVQGYQRRQFARGQVLHRVLLLGGGTAAKDFATFVDKRPWLGVGLPGHVTFEGEKSANGGPKPCGEALSHLTNDLEGLRRLKDALQATGAREVVVALDAEDNHLVPRVTELLTLANVRFKIVPTLFEHTYQSAELLGFAELPVVDVNVDPLDRAARLFKRIMDLTIVTVVSIVGIPLWLVLVLAILIEDGRPVVFKQERVGKNGRHFMLYKFRTMVQNAEQMVEQLKDQNDPDYGPAFKLHNDPRVTKVGRVLRKLSLDELPQLVNVIKGEMSIVGPRPPLPREVSEYEQHHLYRLRGMPGITGLWQVSGRNNLSFEEMVRLDRYYLENWSVRLDMQIIFKTFYVVFARKGAY